MAELHVVGEIIGASGFEDRGLFCKWGIAAGRMWEVLEGLEKGQTHVDFPRDGELAAWSHPLDVHYAAKVRAFMQCLYRGGSVCVDCPYSS